MAQFTDRELDLMQVLWERGPSTVAEARAALEDELAYTTVLTVLRTLEAKGYVTHDPRGKAYVYRAAVARRKAQRHALGSVLARFFGGSAQDLVLALIEDERITPEQLDALRRAAPAVNPEVKTGRRESGGQGGKTGGS